ncbi:cysteine hydrolase [Prosthecobacter fluviatilis]|uniref:Cysteine hydrolase n=1 Tax=Prosthecobacter fluviatilis TaxID=445931 RepID=A0ABW0KWZ9_9BACT
MLDIESTALILVGYQNDYFAQNGILRGVIEEADRVDRTLAHTMDLLEQYAFSRLTIISTPIILKPDYRALANSVGILDTIKQVGAFKEGSPGADTIPELKAYGDRIIYVSGKVGFNAFAGTNLDDVLRERKIKNLLVAGMVTSLCIDSTGRAGYERGYKVTILSDCTSARTPVEQDFFCNHVFPLYGEVANNTKLKAQMPMAGLMASALAA